MKLGICVPHYGRPIEVDRMLAVVRHAEEAGLDSVWVTDHVIVPRDVDVIYREHMLDPLAVLPWLAGVTERISLGTSVVILPYRSPIPMAKLLASGTWTHDLTVTTRLVMGKLTLRLPPDVGVRIVLQRIVAGFDQTGLEKRDDGWYSPNYDAAPFKLKVRAETFFGQIEVQRSTR